VTHLLWDNSLQRRISLGRIMKVCRRGERRKADMEAPEHLSIQEALAGLRRVQGDL